MRTIFTAPSLPTGVCSHSGTQGTLARWEAKWLLHLSLFDRGYFAVGYIDPRSDGTGTRHKEGQRKRIVSSREGLRNVIWRTTKDQRHLGRVVRDRRASVKITL